MHACVCARVHVCVRACMHACVCARVHVCVCACMRACMHVCVSEYASMSRVIVLSLVVLPPGYNLVVLSSNLHMYIVSNQT